MRMTSQRNIAGGFYAGAYGPAILLKLTSRSAVAWLHALLAGISDATLPVRLESHPAVAQRLELSATDDAGLKRLTRTGVGQFSWTCAAAEWGRLAGLLEPFLQGRTGHRYLTSDRVEDALVEVSYGEHDVSA